MKNGTTTWLKQREKKDWISATADQERGELNKIKHRRILGESAALVNDLGVVGRGEKHFIRNSIKRQ
jgi:hypothetical protein